LDDRVKRLESRAEVVRERFLHAVDAIDERRRQVAAMGREARTKAKPVALTVLGITALFGLSAYAFLSAIRARVRRPFQLIRGFSRGSNIVGTRRAWLGRAERPTFLRRVLESVTLALATLAARELAERTMKNFVDGRLPSGRPFDVGAPHERGSRLLHAGPSKS
jgi:hypothetical protein